MWWKFLVMVRQHSEYTKNHWIVLFCVCVCVVLGFELKSYTLSYSTRLFLCWIFFEIVSRTICLGWLQTMILLISASWVARITGLRYWRPANCTL
jgi:ABC-type transport system involved in multi-copper enzyme maturation permease subunit